LFVSVDNSIYKIHENKTVNLNLKYNEIKSIGFTQENILLVGSFDDGLYQVDPFE
jgi:hypothetical protein